MLVVETIAKIRRAFFVQNKPIKEICRDLHIFAEGRAVDALGTSMFVDGSSAFCSPALGAAVDGSWDCTNSFVLNRLNSNSLV